MVNSGETYAPILAQGKIPPGLSETPGVYQFKDVNGHVIYVGKAKNLKKRIQSYFKAPETMPRKTVLMMKKAHALDWILTDSENEAFILESTLIKKFHPRYNIILRDDKQYPCLRMDLQETYPRLEVVRRIKKDGALYFGPFSSAHSVRSTLKVIDRIFQLRKCRDRRMPKRTRPCLNFQMGRCLGPCTRSVSPALYRGVVRQVRLFLEGRNRELIKQLKKEMKGAAEALDFERAAVIRDQISGVERTVEKQHVVSTRLEDKDIIGVAEEEAMVQIALLFVRKGYLLGSRHFLFRGQAGGKRDVVEAFVKQYYGRRKFIPREILVPVSFEDLSAVGAWLTNLAKRKVRIHRPVRGEKRRLVEMAGTNAGSALSGRKKPSGQELMARVADYLHLQEPPSTVEALDISNLSGDLAVGTIVSFVDGRPRGSGYKNYRIKGVEGIDDYGMMAEVVSRRVRKGDLPDLLVVDGGKGHLRTVQKVLECIRGRDKPAIVSIAKPDETRKEKTDKIYIPGRKNPIRLDANDPVLLFLMRVRDEVHRRAVTYHRALRRKEFTLSDLDRIPGIGKRRKKQLLQHFRGLEELAKAGFDELVSVDGISPRLAREITGFFQRRARP